MSKSHALEFSAQFTQEHFPDELLECYIPLELLAQNDHSQTFLMKEKHGDRQFVAKKYETQNACIEEEILSHLSHEGLPVFIQKFKTQDHVYILRTYIPGLPLDKYAERPLSEAEAVKIVQKLCDVLSYLHGQPTPVIHRDIKPSNIIIEPETGKLTLIDFGIARKYSKGATNDTVYMGTQRFSPPEQYGFMQTDKRADIYALGVVLCWLLTGDSDVAASIDGIHCAALRKIIKHCTAFDPEKRYTNVLHVKRDLKHYNGKFKSKAVVAAIALCAALVLFAGGFITGRYTETNVPLFDSFFKKEMVSSEFVVFYDPVLEERVREKMHRPDGDITFAEANKVTRLDLSCSDPGVPEEEKIKDISALAHFKNLSSLSLDWNNISDITPLAGLKNLHTLFLSGNGNIADFSPLQGLTNMKDIMLVGCPITNNNIQVCGHMTDLESLWVESTQLNDISIVSNFPNLNKLVLKNCRIRDISPVAGLTNLRMLTLEKNPVIDLTPLAKLKNLEVLYLWGNWGISDFSPLAELTLMRDLYLYGCENINDTSIGFITDMTLLEILRIEGSPELKDIHFVSDLPHLYKLVLTDCNVSDVSPIAGLKNIKSLTLKDNPITDFSPLKDIYPNLEEKDFYLE